MTVPAWVANLEMELALAQANRADEAPCLGVTFLPYEFELRVLAEYCGAINRWLDRTRIHGDLEARRLWARVCRLFYQYAYFVAMREERGEAGSAREQLVTTAVRLNGLRLTVDPVPERWKKLAAERF